jgi:translation initiation factor 2-alpha kinase 3
MPENTALSQQHPLQGSPGVHIDQYLRDFTELGKVGKGGYGKVLKVRHKLDNSVYAVKRIVVSKLIIEKIHRDGLVAMNSLLEEVRALARLDHKNIVRYFYAWFDYASASASTSMDMSTSSLSGPSNLLEDASSRSCDDETNPEDLPFDELSFNNSNDDMVPDIIFGYSDSGPGPEHSEAEESQDYLGPIVSPRKAITGRKRSATVETIFSTSSNEGTVRPAGDDEEADETIPRSDLQLTQGPAPARRREYVTESTVAAPLLSAPLSTTVLTLNVQMSLYDTNLAIYLNPSLHSDNIAPDSNQLTHCFHPLTSLLLLTEILDGVEYLHSQGIVHRDLKPANIFLSISAAKIPPAGSVNVRACSECPNSSGGAGACYINPRIGDLGLVAALDDNPGSEATTGCPSTTAAAAPVGTEFYRPLTPCNDLAKLDIFSLGVVAVELLRNFDTKMERFETLTALKAGKLPEDFGKGLGRFGAEIEGLVRGMVEGEEEVRFACEEVKRRLAEIVSDMQCL